MFRVAFKIAADILPTAAPVAVSNVVPAVLVILEYIANITAAATMMPPASRIYSIAPWAFSSFKNFPNVFKPPLLLIVVSGI